MGSKAIRLADEPQQMIFWNLIFQAEVVEQRFGAVVLRHHDQQASDAIEIQESMGGCFFLNMLLLNFSLLIDVTFSTPTGYYAN